MARQWQKSDRVAMITTKQQALLHVAKNRLGLTDSDYRSVLSLYGGVESSKELHLEGFRNVLAYLERIGFKNPNGNVFQSAAKPPYSDPNGLPYPAQLNKMQALFMELGMIEAERQQGFCKRVIKKPWAQTRVEANKVIEGLKAMLARKENS